MESVKARNCSPTDLGRTLKKKQRAKKNKLNPETPPPRFLSFVVNSKLPPLRDQEGTVKKTFFACLFFAPDALRSPIHVCGVRTLRSISHSVLAILGLKLNE